MLPLIASLLAMTPAPLLPPPGDAPCSAREREGLAAINWWQGNWDVVDSASGAVVAHSVVAPQPGDACKLRESVTPVGDAGAYGAPLVTLVTYTAKAPNFRQMLVASDGQGSFLWGALQGDQLVLTGIIGDTRPRWTLTCRADGTLRLTIEQSRDGGATWNAAPVRDLTYRRASPATP